jgi:phosphatidylglycerol:prolipoprotein diacylglycerol transferase
MIGFAAGMILACRRMGRAGFSRDTALDIGLIAVLAGVIGARATFLAFDYEPQENGLMEWLAVWQGGLTFQGGLLLAVLAVSLYVRKKGLPFAVMLDIFAPAIALSVGFGRLGCLMNGCCWGRIAAAGSWCSMYFPEDIEPMANQYWLYGENPSAWAQLMRDLGYPADFVPILPVYATQIISAIGLFLIAAWLIWAEKRRPGRPAGRSMIRFLLAYGIGRFLIEFWRDDTPLRFGFGSFPGFRLGQWLALVMMGVAAIWLFRQNRAGRSDGGGG